MVADFIKIYYCYVRSDSIPLKSKVSKHSIDIRIILYQDQVHYRFSYIGVILDRARIMIHFWFCLGYENIVRHGIVRLGFRI